METEELTNLCKKQQDNGKPFKNGVSASNGVPKKKFTWGHSLKYPLDPVEILKATHELPKICTDATVKGTPIQEFYSGAHILVTGATGFMGKFLIEKLLVSCPKISKVYILIREKKGQAVEQRFNQLFNDDVFIRLRKMVPNFKEKIVTITGDCSMLRMGLSDDDYGMLNETLTHIFHGAATVRFDEKIRDATHINVRGVREMLQLSHKCKQLKSVVHISTAYSNCIPDRDEVDEKFYPSKLDYSSLIKLVETENEETLTKMTPKLIEPWPNTYAFTKQIAEDVIQTEGGDLPLCVFRPAVVVASYKEPLRAYCDNIYGPTGIVIGAAMGVLRVLHCKSDLVANLVPVDSATNGVIAAAWKTTEERQTSKAPKIYNYTSTERNPHTWGEYQYWNTRHGVKWPYKSIIWYPMILLVQNAHLAKLATFLLHILPGFLMDCFLCASGQKAKMITTYKKISKFCDVIGYFCNQSWKFHDNNVLQMWKSLTSEDKQIFPFDIADVDWDFYYSGHLLGLRWHIAKDPPETLQVGYGKIKVFFVLHMLAQGLLIFALLWGFANIIGWSFF